MIFIQSVLTKWQLQNMTIHDNNKSILEVFIYGIEHTLQNPHLKLIQR